LGELLGGVLTSLGLGNSPVQAAALAHVHPAADSLRSTRRFVFRHDVLQGVADDV
jgi:hypothetical protein